jgi:hypothetical protein
MTRTTAAVLALGSALTLAACTGKSATPAGGTTTAPAATASAAVGASAGPSAGASSSPSTAPSATPSVASQPSVAATSTVPAASVPATVTSPGTKPSATTSGAASTRCRNAQLQVSLGTNDGGAGQIYTPIVFRNSGSTTCTLVGHPGVSYVTGDEGRQVGASATRTGASKTVTLAPGGTAAALLHETNYSNFDATACKPIKVRGLRIYPPGSKAAVFIARVTTQCSATTLPDPALSIGAVKAGSTG